MKTAKRIGLVVLILLAGIAALLAFNTMRLDGDALAAGPPPPPPIDRAAVERLAQGLRIATVSGDGEPPSQESLAAFAAHLERAYPLVHANLRRERVGGGSLLFTWQGSDPAEPALLLAAHQDVVPAEAGSDSNWAHAPFSGTVANGYVWGRGALDDKASLIAILEAVERQLARGFRPRQTIYLAFGHDEEIGGREGARLIAELLSRRGARVGLALDEGAAVVDGVVPAVEPPLALIGIAEKGYVSVELTASGAGGHSSMPSADNAAVRIARAVERVAEHPLPARLDGPTAAMLDGIAPYSSGAMRVALANRWLTAPLLKRQLLASSETAAAIRTTTAPTMLEAGTKENVLPQRARAVINHRILPGDSIEAVLEHDRTAIADPRVQLRVLPMRHNPGPVASIDSADYRRLRNVIRQSFPHAAVAPVLVLGATDGRHYQNVARSVLRFVPITMTKQDLQRFHGNNERIGIDDYMRAIGFYEQLIVSQAPAPGVQ